MENYITMIRFLNFSFKRDMTKSIICLASDGVLMKWVSLCRIGETFWKFKRYVKYIIDQWSFTYFFKAETIQHSFIPIKYNHIQLFQSILIHSLITKLKSNFRTTYRIIIWLQKHCFLYKFMIKLKKSPNVALRRRGPLPQRSSGQTANDFTGRLQFRHLKTYFAARESRCSGESESRRLTHTADLNIHVTANRPYTVSLIFAEPWTSVSFFVKLHYAGTWRRPLRMKIFRNNWSLEWHWRFP